MAQGSKKSREEIEVVLGAYPRVISYSAVSSEVGPLKVFPQLTGSVVYTIAPVRELDPAEEARAAQSAALGAPAVILIPGRRFDATGTRHGKGFGWYDRFLRIVPREWLRIGFCYSDQFSNEQLVRESWDEPMDYVCVVDKASGAATFLETFARTTNGLVY
jgi:hypothetical protein